MNKLTLITAGVILASFAIAQTARTEFFTTLTGQGKGKARYRVRTTPPQGELQVEAENLRAGAVYKVSVGTLNYTVTADALRKITVAQRWTRNLPAIGIGTPVTVKNAAGTTILSGTLK